MKNKIYIIFIFTLLGCSVSKKTIEASTYESKEKTFTIDTSLKIIQPIQSFNFSSNYDEPIKLETKEYIFTSEVNFETGKRNYIFTPKKDTIVQSVNLTIKESEVKKSSDKKTVNKTKIGFNIIPYIIIAVLLLIIFLCFRIFLKIPL